MHERDEANAVVDFSDAHDLAGEAAHSYRNGGPRDRRKMRRLDTNRCVHDALYGVLAVSGLPKKAPCLLRSEKRESDLFFHSHIVKNDVN